jgi:hypothetical protein
MSARSPIDLSAGSASACFQRIFHQSELGTQLDNQLGMTSEDRRLVRHLAVAVVLKVAVLGVLWWAFVRDARMSPDAEQAATHLGVAAPLTGGSP